MSDAQHNEIMHRLAEVWQQIGNLDMTINKMAEVVEALNYNVARAYCSCTKAKVLDKDVLIIHNECALHGKKEKEEG